MNACIRRGLVPLLAVAALGGAAPGVRAAVLADARIVIEVNDATGDAEVQLFVDARGWTRLEVVDPQGQHILDVTGGGGFGTGLTALSLEGAGSSFEEMPLDQLLYVFPEGRYRVEATGPDGRSQTVSAWLSHGIPSAPEIVAPGKGSVLSLSAPLVIEWSPDASPFPGTTATVAIAAYQVVVERVRPQPSQQFRVQLPAHSHEFTVPAQFLEGNADYRFEVVVVDQNGNRTIREGFFETGP